MAAVEARDGELVGDVSVRYAPIEGGTISGAQVAETIDALPMLAALGPYTEKGIEIRGAQFLERKGNFHAVNVSGIQQPLHVIAQAENRRAFFCVVAANTFEDGRAVADHVRKNVQLGVVPVDEFPVMPNLFGLRYRHIAAPARGGAAKLCAERSIA